jgi:hypothetical protein
LRSRSSFFVSTAGSDFMYTAMMFRKILIIHKFERKF